ncbi:DUF2318 domain-containing protein [Geotalea sp. SG265]|uniref:DUF2318 domain-containing protein n=1 Tax=Geotalea sp. SG265 TaxID=2922867 RepID=UPI001FB01CE7|nr:DUF2318 domain-containing protein [Geotalea sp. SG265]
MGTGLRLGIFTGLLILVGVATVFALNIPGFSKVEKVKAVNGVVSIPVAKVSDGEAHFYRIKEGGKDIGFFIVKGADGALHTAFDSCDVCYKAKKGYEQKGDFMVCKNCNQRFAIAKIGPHAVGGCNPSYLPSTIQGGSVIIKSGDLQSGAKYF